MTRCACLAGVVGVVLLTLGGCAGAPAVRWLSLPLPAEAQARPASVPAAWAGQVLTVRRVRIPEYLQADKVRYRLADSVLGEWPHTAWADRLEVGLTDHLAMRLRLALPGWTVCERSCPVSPSSPVLSVDMAPLDHLRAIGQLRAEVRWQLDTPVATGSKPRQAGAVVKGAVVLMIPVHPDSAEGQAAALGQVLDRLAQDIAGGLQQGP